MTYVNQATDPEGGPGGSCPLGVPCFPRIWLGEAPAGQVNITRAQAIGDAKVWVGLFNSDDVGTKFDLLAEVYKGATPTPSGLAAFGQINKVPGGSSGFNNAKLNTISLIPLPGMALSSTDTVSFQLFVRNTCSGMTHNSGRAMLWFNDAAANSRFFVTVGGMPKTLFLRTVPTLGLQGLGPKQSIVVQAGAPCSPWKLFGTWEGTIP
jgi:hypothetical protein